MKCPAVVLRAHFKERMAMVGVSSRGRWVAWLAVLALIALSTLRAASAIPGIDPETADRYKHLKEAIKVKMLAEKVILDNRGWARPRNVLKQIKEYGETEEGSPLWLLGVLPSQYETRCDYPTLLDSYFKAVKELEPYARQGIFRLVGDVKGNKAEFVEELFNGIGMEVPTDSQVGCLSVLRYNARIAQAAEEGGPATVGGGFKNPGLVSIKPRGKKQTVASHLSHVMASSFELLGTPLETSLEFEQFCFDFLLIGRVPVVLFDDGTGKVPHAKVWSMLSNAPAYHETFAFGFTKNRTLVEIAQKPETDSPTYMAVIPMKDGNIEFPYDEHAEKVEGVNPVVTTFNNAEFGFKKGGDGPILQALTKLRQWLDMIKQHVPTQVREAFHEELARQVEEERRRYEEQEEMVREL